MKDDPAEEIPKAYEAKAAEEKWRPFWKQGRFFQASANSQKKSYCISMPPPNVTGVLHMGHALVQTLQDVLIRWKRMDGFEALWVPGTDHAGIATQTVVERHLMKTEGKRRKDYTREEFLTHVWKWKKESETQILGQIQKLGCSCDWSRLCFTMDENCSRAVRVLFKKMFDEGLIYRGDYLVNWDPITQTALADDEVEYEERASSLWYLSYPLKGSDEKIIIATTRPETMLGDTALAVSPQDERYRHLIGKEVVLPLSSRTIPIISDHRIDPTFGTGVVKVTPAHDPLDYELSKTHNLPLINILTPDGRINDNGGIFAGLKVEEARKKVVDALQGFGLVAKIEPYQHRVGVSYRSKAVIEPFLSKQWFVKMGGFKQELRSAVESGAVRLQPSGWDHTYFHWIDNLRDWCISRQLWWGHQIPIWYRKDDPETMLCYDGPGVPPEVKKEPENWIQDEDVLDTWFSSALWPFSVLGWPEKTPDLAKFYPNSTLVTGHDILFFWVARMILMGKYALGHVPFKDVALQGLIYGKSYWSYDKAGMLAYVSSEEKQAYDLGKPVPSEVHSKWEKMSKSKGNVIDPIEIIETYGADATRFGLCASAIAARQIDLDRRKFEEFKNFVNKIWNGSRFVFLNLKTLSGDKLSSGEISLDLEDRWILSRLNDTVSEVRASLEAFAFDKASMIAYTFFWDSFCAYYLEIVKPILFGKEGTLETQETKQKILTIVLLQTIRLMHPMAPFITEEIFQMLKSHFHSIQAPSEGDPYIQDAIEALLSPACCVAAYPKVLSLQTEGVKETFAFLQEVIHVIRNIRGEMQLPPGASTDLIVVCSSNTQEALLLKDNLRIVKTLVRLNQVSFVFEDKELSGSHALLGNLKLVVPLPEAFKEKEKLRLTKEREKLIAQENSLRTQLGNQEFLTKAPPALIQKLSDNLAFVEKSLKEITTKLEKEIFT